MSPTRRNEDAVIPHGYHLKSVLKVAGPHSPGYHFERGMKWPRQKSLMKMKDRLRAKTSRLDGRSLPEIVKDVNRSLRGWYQYYRHSKATLFSAMDGYVRRRLGSLLQWRLDGVVKGIGATHQRWPNEWFARGGLVDSLFTNPPSVNSKQPYGQGQSLVPTPIARR